MARNLMTLAVFGLAFCAGVAPFGLPIWAACIAEPSLMLAYVAMQKSRDLDLVAAAARRERALIEGDAR